MSKTHLKICQIYHFSSVKKLHIICEAVAVRNHCDIIYYKNQHISFYNQRFFQFLFVSKILKITRLHQYINTTLNQITKLLCHVIVMSLSVASDITALNKK